VAHRRPRTPSAHEIAADDALTARLAHVPPAVTNDANPMLGDEDAPPAGRACANAGKAFRVGGRRARDAEGYRVPKRARIAGRLESERVAGCDPVAGVQPEGDAVELRPVVALPSAATRRSNEPMGKLVEQRQALVEWVVASANADHPGVASRHTCRV
jgi:hypothetical protein